MHDFRKSLINSTLNKVLQRLHYPLEVMLTCVRWYVAYPLSLRHIEEMMQERGVLVDHSTGFCRIRSKRIRIGIDLIKEFPRKLLNATEP